MIEDKDPIIETEKPKKQERSGLTFLEMTTALGALLGGTAANIFFINRWFNNNKEEKGDQHAK